MILSEMTKSRLSGMQSSVPTRHPGSKKPMNKKARRAAGKRQRIARRNNW